jgi:hypothetical protein
MNWKRAVASVLVVTSLSMWVAPKASANLSTTLSSGTTLAAVNWKDEWQIFVVFWLVTKAMDWMVQQIKWQRIIYGGGCSLGKWALRNGIEESIRQMAFGADEDNPPPPELIDRITNNLWAKTGCA